MESQIEILRDPELKRLESALFMDERHHVLEDGDWIRAARRWTGIDELFVYRHSETGNFVLAQWLKRFPPVCQEVEVMGTSAPDQGGWLPRTVIEWRCQPHHVMMERMRQQTLRHRAARERRKAESHAQKQDAVKYAKGKGMEGVAAGIQASPYVGDLEGGDRLLEVTDRISSAAADRLVSYPGAKGR